MNTSHLQEPPSSLPSGSTVWAYLRDSGGSRQDRSIEQQRNEVLQYCREHGFIISHPPFEDLHKTGSNVVGRDQFYEMVSLSASEAERPAGLLIWNFARFARDVDDAQIYKGILRKRGVIIHSLTDEIPEGPFAHVIETLIHVSDEQKRREAAMGSWRGLRHVVKQGAMPGVPPRGFMKTPVTITSEQGIEREAHRWDPDPEWMNAVKTAFEMRAARRPLAEINETTKLYGSLNSYRTFFSNKIYMGVLEFGTLVIEDYCSPIISRELWEKVQIVQSGYEQKRHLETGSPNHPRRQHSEFTLSGLSYCARCDSPLYGHHAKQRSGPDILDYRCTRGHRRRDCDLPRIPARDIENAVLAELDKTLFEPDYLLALIEGLKHKHATLLENFDQQRRDLERDLKKLRRQISNLTEAISESGHSAAMLKRLRHLEEDETQIKQSLKDLKPPPLISIPQPASVAKKLSAISQRIHQSPPSIQRQILLGFIERITVDRIDNILYSKIDIYLPGDLLEGIFSTSPTPDSGTIPPIIPVPTSFAPMGAPLYRHSISFSMVIVKKKRVPKQ